MAGKDISDFMSQSELLAGSNLAGHTHGDPLVSIGMPVYNEEQHLRKTLDSLLAQDFGNLEIIISDNASTDRTAVICQEYSLQDSRVSYYRNETNLGSVPNFNRVFEPARGAFFMWASGHDLYHKTFISRCSALLLTDPSVVLCHPQALWVDVSGQPLELISDSLDTRGVISQLSRLNMVLWRLSRTAYPFYGMIRRSALEQTALQQKVAAPDVALLVELSLLGTFAHIPEQLFYVQKPDDSGSWRVYTEKHFKHTGGAWSGQMLFWRMLLEMIRGVNRHVDSFPERVKGIISVIVCMFWKYHGILVGLLSLSVPKRTIKR
jgi:glycosyl transferase family 2